jgi:hypothetical protein
MLRCLLFYFYFHLQPSEDWPSIIGGSSPPGNRWRLVFTSGTKQVQEALKGAGKGGGNYVPLTGQSYSLKCEMCCLSAWVCC